ncbi:hypothetical protein GCM10029964_026940 [Kibdelosporangium lantanae]
MATLLVADGVRHPDAAAALVRRWDVEEDRTTRADLVLAFGTAYTWAEDETLRERLLALLADDDLQLRLAAVHALAEFDPDVASRHVGTLVRAVLHQDAVLWRDSGWIGGRLGTIVNATGRLLMADPDAASTFALGVTTEAGSGDLRHVQWVLSCWRTATDEMLPLLGACLDDQLSGVRYEAAALLACLGEQASAYADQLFVRTTDTASRHGMTVGDAAVWALARQNHPGCLPGLVDRLTGDRLGFDVRARHFGGDVPVLWLPAIHEVLIPLREHADALLGALTEFMAGARHDTVLASNLCHVVAAWGPVAAEAMPAVADLVDNPKVLPAAAKALGAIGPAAADVVRTLDAAELAVAWALWRTGADPDRGVAALVHAVAQPKPRHPTIALLADVGPQAVAGVDTLRTLAGSTDDWTRVEAAHALWRVTGDPDEPVAILTALAQPLADGSCLPVGIAALCHLAEIRPADDHVRAVARAIHDNPRRIAWSGGWRTFTEDERIRAAASVLLG